MVHPSLWPIFRPNSRTESDESTAALLAGSHWGKALFWGDPAMYSTDVQVRAHIPKPTLPVHVLSIDVELGTH